MDQRKLFAYGMAAVAATLVETELVYYSASLLSFSALAFAILKSLLLGALFILVRPSGASLESKTLFFSVLAACLVWTWLGPGVLTGDIRDYLNLVEYPQSADEEYSPFYTFFYYSFFKIIEHKYVYLGLGQLIVFYASTAFFVSRTANALVPSLKLAPRLALCGLVFFNPVVLGQSLYYTDLFFCSFFLLFLGLLISRPSGFRAKGSLLLLAIISTGFRLNSLVLAPILPFFFADLFAGRRKNAKAFGFYLLYIAIFLAFYFSLKALFIHQKGSYGVNIPMYELSILKARQPQEEKRLAWLENYVSTEKVEKNLKERKTKSFSDTFFPLNAREEGDLYNRRKLIKDSEEIYKRYALYFLDNPLKVLGVKANLYLNQLMIFAPTIPEPFFFDNKRYMKEVFPHYLGAPLAVSPFHDYGVRKLLRDLFELAVKTPLRFAAASPVFYLLFLGVCYFRAKKDKVFRRIARIAVFLPALYHLSFYIAPYGYGIKYLLPLLLPVQILTALMLARARGFAKKLQATFEEATLKE